MKSIKKESNQTKQDKFVIYVRSKMANLKDETKSREIMERAQRTINNCDKFLGKWGGKNCRSLSFIGQGQFSKDLARAVNEVVREGSSINIL